MRKIIAAIIGTILLCACDGPSKVGLGPSISGPELAVLLKRHPDFSGTGPVVDEKYRLVTKDWVKSNVAAFTTGDCDDYAGEAWRTALTHGRVAFGMVISSRITDDNRFGAHAFNFFIDPDQQIWFYEPQTHQTWKPTPEEMWYVSWFWI